MNSTAQVAYGIVIVLTTAANLWLSRSLQKIENNKHMLQASSFRVRWLSIDILVKLAGLVISAFLWAPATMVAVFIAAFVIAFPSHFFEGRRVRKSINGDDHLSSSDYEANNGEAND